MAGGSIDRGGASRKGCRVRVKAGVEVGRSRPFRPESESELESAKFCRLPLRSSVVDDNQ